MATPSLVCPGCRSPVPVPADHTAATIRCGICWTDIRLSTPAPLPVATLVSPLPVAVLLPPRSTANSSSGDVRLPKSSADVALSKPAAGMSRLEALLDKAANRMTETGAVPQDKEPVASPQLVAVPVLEPTVVPRRELVPPPPRPASEPRMTLPPMSPPAPPPTVSRPTISSEAFEFEEPRPRRRARRPEPDDTDTPAATPTAWYLVLGGAAVGFLMMCVGIYLFVQHYMSAS